MSDSFSADTLNEVHSYGLIRNTREIFLPHNADLADNITFETTLAFLKNFAILTQDSTKKPIFINLMSGGGGVEYGMALYDCISQYCSTVGIVHGLAYSSAAFILQSCTYRLMMPNASLMLHHGYLTVDDTVQSAKSYLKCNDNVAETVFNIYANRCIVGSKFVGKTLVEINKYIRKMIDKHTDWYLSAEEAVAYGFADAICNSDKSASILQKVSQTKIYDHNKV